MFNRDGHFAAGLKLCDASNTVAIRSNPKPNPNPNPNPNPTPDPNPNPNPNQVARVPSDSTVVAWGLGILEGVLPSQLPSAPAAGGGVSV